MSKYGVFSGSYSPVFGLITGKYGTKKLRIWTLFKQCKEEIIRKIRKKQRLNKDDLIRLALDYQQKYDITLDKISTELAELRKSYNKLEPDLAITKAFNESLRNQILTLERQCWSNAQYSRRETLGISGIPENIDDGELEGKVLTVLSKLDVYIDSANVEACHWLKSNKKAILKLSRQKDSDEIRRVSSKLKTTDLKPIGITTPVYINDSLCFYYKKLWSKCKNLWSNKFIFGYWVSNGSIKIRISESSPVKVISHIVDLEKLFPDNPLLKDDHIEA